MKHSRKYLIVLVIVVLGIVSGVAYYNRLDNNKCETGDQAKGIHTLEVCLKPGTTLDGQ